MANIFSLYGSIFIDNEKANTSIDSTTKKAENSGTKVGAAFKAIGKSAAAVGTAVVGAATTLGAGALAMVNKTADACDHIDKLSERTGINREELQRWEHAASQSGANVDNFANGVKKMSGVISDAASGNKTAQETLKGLGLSYKDLSEMTPEAAFDKVTSALADMEQGTARNALGNDIFGKSYTDMLPLLNAGSEGIQDLKKEADDLGLVMGEDTVKAGVKFGDTLANVKDAVTAIFNKLGANLLPILQKVLDVIIQNIPTIQNVIAQVTPIISALFEKMLPPLMDLAQQIFPILMDLLTQIMPVCMDIITAILPVITDLLNMLLPPITEIVKMILPLLLSLLQPLLPLLQPIIALLQPVIDILMALIQPLIEILNLILPPLIDAITQVISFILPPLQNALEKVAGVLSGVFKGAFEALKPIIEAFKTYLSGIIDFITGVFSGDWSKAWEGVKKIFKGIIDGLAAIFKAPINFIIDGINLFIRGLNKIKIPDWVPAVGGKGFHLDELKKLRIGLEYVPYDDMPALLHKGERVLTASEAKQYKADAESKKNKTVLPLSPKIEIKIDKFINNRKQDVKELVDEIMEIAEEKRRMKAGVFA